MKYKIEYKPSELLCPVNYTWVDINKEILELLNVQKYIVLSKINQDQKQEKNITITKEELKNVEIYNDGIIYTLQVIKVNKSISQMSLNRLNK